MIAIKNVTDFYNKIIENNSKNLNCYLSDKDAKAGKEFIDKNYPDRHTLIIGNSLNTVPEYFKKENKKFDLIFIDGGHDYDIAKYDLP